MTKVLIVDDHRENAAALAMLIEASWKLPGDEMKVVVVHTMEDARKERDDSNVTILDLDLPDSSPEDTMAEIKNFPPPVIVLTGCADDALSAACMVAGAAHVFIKGSLMGFIPTFFKALQLDVLRRAGQRHEPQ